MFTKEIRNTIKLLEWTGHWFNYDNKTNEKYLKIFQIFRLTYLGIALSLNAYTIYLKGLKKSLESFGVFFPMTIMCLLCAMLIAINNVRMKDCLVKLNSMIENHKENWEHEIFQEDSEFIWNIVKKYLKTIIMYYLLYTPIPLFIDFIAYNCNLYDGPPLNLPQTLSGFMDDQPVRDGKYYTIILFSQMLTGIGIPNYSGNVFGFCIITVYIRVEMKIIQKKILLLNDIDNNLKKVYYSKLVEIIERYLQIKSILKDLEAVYGAQFALQNALAPISTSFCLNLIVMLEDKSVAPAYLICSLVLTTGPFICCLAGESLQEENSNINKLIYNLKWYEWKSRDGRMVLMMLEQTSLSMTITCKGLSPMGMHTFQEIMNKTYSYCMLLRSLS
uniref:Odorant receptor n=1 Tax=Rhodnius prolixus TaxID=13249 RepID=T1HB82_RHOPR